MFHPHLKIWALPRHHHALMTCHKPQFCLGTRPSTGGGTCLATLKLAGATSMFRVSHSSMGRPRRAGERASKVMFAKNQSVLRFIDILPSKVSLGYGARAKKTARFFLCVGGKSPPERLFRLWAQYAATPSLYDQTQDLPGFLACGWGDNAPQQKKLKKNLTSASDMRISPPRRRAE